MIYKIKASVYHITKGKIIVYFYSFHYYWAWVKLTRDFNHVYWMNVYFENGYKNFTSHKKPINY